MTKIAPDFDQIQHFHINASEVKVGSLLEIGIRISAGTA